MLDPQSSFEVSALPAVRFFRDSRLPQGFYAVAIPCIATEEDGVPQLSLMVYGHKDAHSPDLKVRGGVLTLTTTLALDPTQERTAHSALADWMKQQASPLDSAGSPPLSPLLLAVDWIGGEVEVALTESIRLYGKVAGVGGLRCSLQQKLDADNTKALQQAWKDGLPNGFIQYRMQARTEQGSMSLLLQGPLSLSSSVLQRCLLIVGL